MDTANNEKIFKPVLEISYEEIPTNMINPATKTQLSF